MRFLCPVRITILMPLVIIIACVHAVAVKAQHVELTTKLPPITAVAIDEANGWVIEGSQQGLMVRTWPDLSPTKNLGTQLEHINDIALSPDGTMLIAAGGTPAEFGAAELYHWPSGELWKQLQPHGDLIYAVAWQSESKLFALASADKSVKVFSPSSDQGTAVFAGNSRPVLAVEFLPGELGVITAGVDESLRVWEYPSKALAPAVLKRTFTNHTRPVNDLALRPADHLSNPVIASIGEDNTVRLWQPTIGRMMRFAKLDAAPRAVCWIGQGSSLAVACADGMVRIVNPDTVEVTREFVGVEGVAYCLAAHSRGELLVGGAQGQLKRWATH